MIFSKLRVVLSVILFNERSKKFVLVDINENVLVISVNIVNWNEISLEVLLISDLFFKICIILWGIFIFLVSVFIVIVFVGVSVVVNVNVVVKGIVGIK